MFKKIPIFAMFLCLLALMTAAQGQAGKGVIVGQVRDAAGSTLHGAKIDLQPRVQPVTSDMAPAQRGSGRCRLEWADGERRTP